MTRVALRVLAVLLAMGPAAHAQFNWVGAGSTPEGDYLRGVGIAAFGLGSYNLNTAQANSINVNTEIRWNEYVTMYFARENEAKARYRAAMREHNEEKRKAILDRIKNSPQEHDLHSGDALNALIDALNDPKISESSYRSAKVSLPADVVRRIPFRLDAEGVEFSMHRLIPRGTGKWPVAMQDARFDNDRRAYERAVDAALEQQIGGKMSFEVIDGVKQAVEGLDRALAAADLPPRDRRSIDAKDRIKELRAMARLLESHKIELALGEVDRYSGTTVNDLRQFMQKYKLHFAASNSPDERSLYPGLYEVLAVQKMMMEEGINPGT
ncbi:MAG TPA: hypothetical protein VGH33_05530 [Isosphaeraceae bacterium]